MYPYNKKIKGKSGFWFGSGLEEMETESYERGYVINVYLHCILCKKSSSTNDIWWSQNHAVTLNLPPHGALLGTIRMKNIEKPYI